jgi:hypothetical protein
MRLHALMATVTPLQSAEQQHAQVETARSMQQETQLHGCKCVRTQLGRAGKLVGAHVTTAD